jgi:hypothetical protein
MNTARGRMFVLVFGLAFGAMAGCNSGGPKMVRIRGIVTYKGAPLTNVPQGIVRYLPKEPGAGAREATGRLQPDGTFVMTTFQKDDGVVFGEYNITVSAYSTQPLSRQETESGVRGSGPRLLVPERYLKPGSSGLSDSVVAGHEGFKTIELTDKS